MALVLAAALAPVLRGSAPLAAAPLVAAWLAQAARHGAPAVLTGLPAAPQGRLDPELGAFLDGRSDFAFLTREIAEADLARFRAAQGGDAPVVVPVAGGSWNGFGLVDPVVVIVNAANPLRAIDFRQLDALLSTTRWRGGAAPADWAALGTVGWKGKAIHVVGGEGWAGEESARALVIRRRVLSVGGRTGAWRRVPGSGPEADVVARVAADPAAIGFTGLGHLKAGVRALAVNGGGAAVAPTQAAIAAGRYPLARTVDLLLPRGSDGCVAPEARRFAGFLLSPLGQAVVRRQAAFLPLTPGQRRAAWAALACPPIARGAPARVG